MKLKNLWIITALAEITGSAYLYKLAKGMSESQAKIAVLRDELPRGLRYDVMKSDGYRCQICNRGKTEGAFLHVDHKIPLAKGGTNARNNLWTLCEDCNMGKGAKDL